MASLEKVERIGGVGLLGAPTICNARVLIPYQSTVWRLAYLGSYAAERIADGQRYFPSSIRRFLSKSAVV